MKRLLATTLCTLLLAAAAMAQGLQERNLGDAQPPAANGPSAQVSPAPAPAQTTPAQTAPGQTAPPAAAAPAAGETAPPPHARDTSQRKYSKEEVHREVMNFFDGGSAGLAELVAKAFKDMGQPSGYIKGSEAGGALLVGLRYGTGYLYLKGHKPVEVFWQSPSVGIDLGLNAVRVFTLVYGVSRPEEIFRRFPGVDGSAYLIGGFGMNYQSTDGLVLAPIRFGVGLRLGANVGYQHYTRTQEINPF